jgi:branched-chain amino acid transport system permease protein
MEGSLVSKSNRRSLMITIGVLLVLIVIPLIDLSRFGIYPGPFVGTLADAGTYVMLALGLNIVVGYAGLLDLGYAAFFAIGSYTYALLASPLFNQHYSFWILILIAPAVAAFFGMLLGAPTLRLRGDYLAIVTLGFGEIVPAFFLNAQSLTGGTNGISGVDTPVIGIPFTAIVYKFGLGGNNPYPYYYLVVIVVLVLILAIGRLRDSRIGRAWMAIREDELAASAMGINTVRTKLLAFGIGAAFSGFAGCIYASKLGFIGPDQFSFSVSVFILSMIILGGIGTIRGVIIGAVLLYFLQTYILTGLPGWINDFGNSSGIAFLRDTDFSGIKFLLYGIALVAMMVLRPEGLLPNRQRKAELHPESDTIALRESQQQLYDVQATDQQEVGEPVEE